MIPVTPSISLDDSEFEERFIRAPGPGGQKVNKTESAVRITHLSSGIAVQCQSDRSQHKNRATAWAIAAA